MFTGLIEEIGAIQNIQRVASGLRLKIQCRKILDDLAVDDSVSVNGVCLTVVQFDAATFQADAVAETVARTNLRKLSPGSRVNLERALRLSDRLGGHLVQGHVDGTGVISRFDRLPNNTLLTVKAPAELMQFMIPKGSIAIDGVSLTIADLTESLVTIAVIPHTLEKTILNTGAVGDEVNLEVDLIGKYISRFVNLNRDKNDLTIDKLKNYGFA
jgi:riboflavin synthase